MLEEELKELFTAQAAADMPAERISLPAVRRKAVARRHRREIAAIGSPILAACAVLAIALAGLLPASGHGTAPSAGHSRHHRYAAGTHSPVRAPRQFDMLVPYAAFGWLPHGVGRQEMGETSPAVDSLTSHELTLTTFAYDACRRTSQTELNCPSLPLRDVRLGKRAPDVNGHAAYWASALGRGLAWQYAPGGWVILSESYKPVRTMARIANAVFFGVHQPIRFAAQITRPPAGVAGLTNTLHYSLRSGVLLADNYAVFHQATRALTLTISFGGHCPNARQTIINGYHVRFWPYQQGPVSWTSTCVVADGLRITMFGPSKPSATSAISIFRHLTILGANPSRWVSQPEN